MPNESGEWIMRGLDWDDPLRIRTPEELETLDRLQKKMLHNLALNTDCDMEG